MTRDELIAHMAQQHTDLMARSDEALNEARRLDREEKHGLADAMRSESSAFVSEARAWREARALVKELDCHN